MPLDSDEATKMLAEADRIRVALRKATLEMRALGDEILERRSRDDRFQGPDRSGGSAPPRR